MRIIFIGAALVGALAVSAVAQAQPYNVPDNALGSQFIRGDANQDGTLNIADAIRVLSFLFPNPPPSIPLICADAGDANNDENLNIADAITILGFLFSAGAPFAPPYPFVDGDPMPGFPGLSNAPNNLGCKPVMKDALGNINPAQIVGGGSGVVSVDTVLTSDRTWIIVGVTRVDAGVTLTIEPGTTLIGRNIDVGGTTIPGVLYTAPGNVAGTVASARLVANGTEVRPIVFTSAQPVGMRARGDWGGLVLLGRGINNYPGGQAEIEGLNGIFFGGGVGNPYPDDDSGSLSFVRVEYAGFELAANNELNGITLGGCGSETQLHHLMVKFNLDDGIEWFGGSASLKYAFTYGIRDDNFDWSFGFDGFGQFWVCEQRADTGNRGFEIDNNETTFTAAPLTNPLVSNVTLLGGATAGERQGIIFRRGAGSRVYNSIIEGWTDCGLDIDDAVTTDNNPTTGTLVLDHCAFALNNENAETGDSEVGFAYSTVDFMTLLNTNNAFLNTSLVNSRTDFTPAIPTPADFRVNTSVPGLPTVFTTLPTWFDAPTFVGGVAPGGTAEGAWTRRSWISYMQN